MNTITMNTQTLEKKGKSFYEVENLNSEITPEQYKNILGAKKFFQNLGGSERETKNYTSIGYVTVRLSSVNPDKTTKVIRNFSFN